MTIDEAEDALRRAQSAINTRRAATDDQAEKARLLAEVRKITDQLAVLANADLERASLNVMQAADALEGFLKSARVDVFDAAIEDSFKAMADAAKRLADRIGRDFAADAPSAVETGDVEEPDFAAPEPPATPAVAAGSPPVGLPPIVVGKTLATLADDYRLCWAACRIRDQFRAAVEKSADRLLRGTERYRAVAGDTRVPWQLIGVMHGLECGYDFNKHLHNGDSLAAKTVRVPKGFPKNWVAGMPWEVSAEDALQLKKLHQVAEWSLPRVLFTLEAFNGFGYRGKGIRSPYLWSFSNLYEKGKYVADHVYDENAVSKQVGSALVLKALEERGLWP